MSVPKTEAEAIAELRRVEDCLGTLKRGMMEIEHDSRYSSKDRDAAKSIREFCDVNYQAVTDVIAGLSQIFATKNPSAVASIIAELTKK